MKLILVRHGETEENVARVFSDVVLGNLNENGIRQATELGKELASKEVEAIYCSPADRCRQTLGWILKQTKWQVPIIYSEEIRERNFGQYIGQPTSMLSREDRNSDSEKIKQMGVETNKEIHQRIGSFVETIKSRHGSQTVLVVSHGDPLTRIYGLAVGKSFEEISTKIDIKNAKVIEIEI